MVQHRICFIGGDGVGPEVVAHARRVLDALGVNYTGTEARAGYACYQECGSALPDATVQAARASDAVLFGAVTTPPNIPNYSSAIVGLRKALDLYANVRPCRSYPNVPCLRPDIDLVIVRENTEGMYSGRERREDGGNTAISERVITRRGRGKERAGIAIPRAMLALEREGGVVGFVKRNGFDALAGLFGK